MKKNHNEKTSDIFFVFLFLFLFIVISTSTFYGYLGRLPYRCEYPLKIAPALTFSIGVCICRDQLRIRLENCTIGKYIINLNWYAMVVIFFICFTSAMPMKPQTHICFMIVLFAFFLIWDYFMIMWLKNIKKYSPQRESIIIANRLINWPTFGSLSIIAIIVYFFTGKVDETKKELFVSGAISFHLAIVAIAYFTLTHIGLEPKFIITNLKKLFNIYKSLNITKFVKNLYHLFFVFILKLSL